MRFTGTARNVEFLEPGGLGGLLRNNGVVFLVNTAAPVNLPSGTISWVPVRFECFLRVPSFDGQTVDIEGEFDEFDRMVRGKRLSVQDSGIFVGAIRTFGFFSALLLLVVLGALVYAASWLSLWLYWEFADTVLQSGSIEFGRVVRLFIGISLDLVLVCGIGLTLLYVSRVAIPAIYRMLYRFLRFISEVRPQKHGR